MQAISKPNSNKFQNMKEKLDVDDSKLSLLIRKGIYPYEYMDSFDRFNETKLPHKEESTK